MNPVTTLKKVFCSLAILLALNRPAMAVIGISWTNVAGGDWNVAQNWSPNQIPGPNDNTQITTPGTYTVTINSDDTIKSLTLGGSSGQQILAIGNGVTLTVTNGAQVGSNGVIQANSGTFNSKTSTVNGLVALSGGYLSGSMTISSIGTLTLNSGRITAMNLTNHGTVTWTADHIYAGQGLYIYNDGLWDAQCDTTLIGAYYGGNAATFDNHGTVRKSLSPGVTVYDGSVTFNNYGTVNAASGTIYLYGSNTANDGCVFTGASDSSVQIGNSVTSTWTGTINSTNLLLQGAAIINGTCRLAGVLSVSAGYLEGTMTVNSNSTLSLSSGRLVGATLTNNGTIAWLAGDHIYGGSGSVIYNHGVFDAQGDYSIIGSYYGGAAFVFDNYSVLRKSGGGGATTLDGSTVFNNYGTVDLQNGDLYTDGPSTAADGSLFKGSGTYYIAGSSTATWSGTIHCTNVVLSSGSVLNGTNTLAGNLSDSAGYFEGNLTVAPGSVLTLVSGYFEGATVTNNGTINWLDVNHIFAGYGTHIVNNSLWDAQSQYNIFGAYWGGDRLVFDNYGTFRKSTASTGTSVDGATTFNNYGLVDVVAGQITFNSPGTGSSASSFAIATNSDVVMGGGYTFLGDANFTGPGSVYFRGGTFNMNGTLTAVDAHADSGSATLTGTNVLVGTLTDSTGYLEGTLTISNHSTLNLASGYFEYLTLTNNGTINWLDVNHVFAGYGTHIVNNGLWDAQSQNNIFGAYWGGAGLIFDNYGTFRKSTAATGTSVDTSTTFNNYGLVDVAEGQITFNSSGTGGAASSFNVATNSDVILSGGYTFLGDATFTGPGSVYFHSGTFSMNGTLTATDAHADNGAAITGTNMLVGILTDATGYLEGTMTVSNHSTLNLANGYFDGLTLTNHGTVNWLEGDHIRAGFGTYIYNDGLWDAQSSFTFFGTYFGGAGLVFDNHGTFRKSTASTGTALDSSTTFNNYGLVDVVAGTMTFNSSGTGGSASSFNIATNASAILSGGCTFLGDATFTGPGSIYFHGGTFSMNGTLTATNAHADNGAAITGTNVLVGILTDATGYLEGTMTVSNHSTLNLANGYFESLTLTNHGTVNWLEGDHIRTGFGTYIYNDGLWDAQSSFTFFGAIFGGTGLVFDNHGTFRKSTASTGTALDGSTTFNNYNLIDVEEGSLSMAGSYTAEPGSGYNFGLNGAADYGQLYFPSATTLTGSVGANFNHGYFPVEGDTYHLIHFSSSSGTFTNAMFPAGAIWQTNYTDTTFDLVALEITNEIPLAITTQPSSLTNNAGTTALFNVGVSGTHPHYQWYKGAAALSNSGTISGSTASTLSLSSLLRADAGNYSVVCFNSANSVTSSIVTLSVNDPAINGQPADVGFLLTAGGTGQFHVDAAGTGTLTYQWYLTNKSGIKALTNKVGVITGVTTSTLTVTQNKTKSATATNFFVVVTGDYGSVTSRVASLVSFVPPIATVKAAPKLLVAGNNSKLTAKATKGTPPFTYLWKVNGQLIDGATNSVYLATNLQAPPGTEVFPFTNVYVCYISNYFGFGTSATATVGIKPDTNSPSVSFTYPVANAQITNLLTRTTNAANGDVLTAPQFVLSGKVSDNGLITNLYFQKVYPTFEQPQAITMHQTAPGKVTFSNELTLVEGTNTYHAWAMDSAGNPSKVATRTVFCVKPWTVEIDTNGYGVTTPVGSTQTFALYGEPTNGAPLQIGRSYKVLATADPNNIFTNWTDGNGAILASTPQLTFKMTNGLVLRANFVTNPIVAAGVSGKYNGLFYEVESIGPSFVKGVTAATPPVAPNVKLESAGSILNLAVKTNGTFSGKLNIQGISYSLAATFDLTGNKTVTVSRAAQSRSDLTVTMHLDWSDNTRQITGNVASSADGWTAPFVLDQAFYNTNNNIYPLAARYTLSIPSADASGATSPGGTGIGAITNSPAGNMTLVGKGADGTAIAQVVPISKDGKVPIYVKLYNKLGLLEGWLNIGPTSLGGTLTWIKPATNVPATYVNGFTNVADVTGEIYTNRPGTVFGNTTNLLLTLSDHEGFTTNIAGNPLSWHMYLKGTSLIVNTNVANPTNKVSGSVATKDGTVALSYQTTAGGIKKTLSGVIDQANDSAAGFLIGTNNAGGFILSP